MFDHIIVLINAKLHSKQFIRQKSMILKLQTCENQYSSTCFYLKLTKRARFYTNINLVTILYLWLLMRAKSKEKIV